MVGSFLVGTEVLRRSFLVGLAGAAFAPDCAFEPLTDVPANQGVLYIYRPRAFYGAGFGVPITIDDTVAGEVRSGAYLALTLSPGPRVISSRRSVGLLAAAATPLEIEATSGSNQFVRAVVNQTGPFSSRVVLTRVEGPEALSEIASLRRSD